MDTRKLKALLVLDEGLRLKPYQDTIGKTTIGVGRNLTDVGISKDEADYLLSNDITAATAVVARFLPTYTSFVEPRQAVFLGLAFNLGPKLGLFTHLLSYANSGDWKGAGAALQHSLWWRQVGSRGPRYQQMLITGEWPPQLLVV